MNLNRPVPSEIPVLHGDKILLRPLREDDFEMLGKLVQEASVAAWWPRADADVVRRETECESVTAFALELEGETIGMIQYEEEDDPDYRYASMDLFLGTRWQGKGYGREALVTLARYLFKERGHHRLTIDPALANERAIAVYERVGFTKVRTDGEGCHYELRPASVASTAAG